MFTGSIAEMGWLCPRLEELFNPAMPYFMHRQDEKRMICLLCGISISLKVKVIMAGDQSRLWFHVYVTFLDSMCPKSDHPDQCQG